MRNVIFCIFLLCDFPLSLWAGSARLINTPLSTVKAFFAITFDAEMETAAFDFRFTLSNVVRIYTTWSARGKRCGDENTILKSVAIDLCTLASLLRTKQEWPNWSIAAFGLSVTKLLSDRFATEYHF